MSSGLFQVRPRAAAAEKGHAAASTPAPAAAAVVAAEGAPPTAPPPSLSSPSPLSPFPPSRAHVTARMIVPLNAPRPDPVLVGDEDAAAAAAEAEIAQLEAQLKLARLRLGAKRRSLDEKDADPESRSATPPTPPTPPPLNQAPTLSPSTHLLLLLSDSALPLGAFAFSSGLESYLAHGRAGRTAAALPAFLPLSVAAYASTTLPFALAAHRDPAALARLDDALDAALVCTVGRRASVAQGRALVAVWDRCFAPAVASAPDPDIAAYIAAVKAGTSGGGTATTAAAASTTPPGLAAPAAEPPTAATTTTAETTAATITTTMPPTAPAAHLAPLFGAVCRAAGLSAQQAAFVLMLGHVKALVSAAVRAGALGPYQAQRLLAGENVRRLLDAAVQREWDTPVELAGQSVPVMDLWVGRHELLYSRIFNS